MGAVSTEVAAVRGRAKKQASMLAFIDPETLIPADHPLRTIKRFADAALVELSPMRCMPRTVKGALRSRPNGY